MQQLLRIPLDKIRPDPNQPRKDFDPEGLRRLKATIEEHGQVIPASVRPAGEGEWILVDGERRWRALVELAREQPSNERHKVLIAVEGDLAERDLLVIQFLANEQRVGHTPLEKLGIVERLRTTGHADDAIPDLLGMTKGEYRYLRQFATAPEWLKAYGARMQIKRPVVDEQSGEPKRDEGGKVKYHAWTFDPLPLTHLIELAKLATRLLRYDEKRFVETQGTHKPIAERKTRHLAEAAITEGWGVKKLQDEAARLVRRVDNEDVSPDTAGQTNDGQDTLPVPRQVLSAFHKLPRSEQIGGILALLQALNLKPSDLVSSLPLSEPKT